jgi:DNA-binding MarR family transcriptional regulator
MEKGMSFHLRLNAAAAGSRTQTKTGERAGERDFSAGSTDPAILPRYVETLGLIERLHRLLLDVIKDEFERLGVIDVNAVQALLLFNIGDNEVTAGELKTRGYYQGSNVSYNLKKLVETGYIHHQRCAIDRRSVRVRLTGPGREIAEMVSALVARHAEGLPERGILGYDEVDRINAALRRLERYWADQIRYIY